MPADRLIHPRSGHSRKVTMLTDMEFRTWIQYLMSADDFGVMRATAITLQADNDALAARKPKQIQRAVDVLVTSGLVREFTHQGLRYVYQHDWQSWQKVSYPRGTDNPCPPPEAMAECDEATRDLFKLHPGGKGRKVPKRSENVSETVQESSQNGSETFSTTRAGAPADRLTANANGQGYRQTAPLHDRSHIKHAHCGRVCLHASLFGEFVRRRNHPGADAEIRDWALAVEHEWADKPEETGDPFDFWRARYAEKWPAPVAVKADPRRPSWAV